MQFLPEFLANSLGKCGESEFGEHIKVIFCNWEYLVPQLRVNIDHIATLKYI